MLQSGKCFFLQHLAYRIRMLTSLSKTFRLVMVALIFCWMTFCKGTVVCAQVPFADNFDAGHLNAGWITNEIAPSTGLGRQVTTEAISRLGTGALRTSLHRNDPEVSTSRRTELVRDGIGGVGTERWYGWSVFLPNDYQVDPNSFEILGQFHSQPDFHLGEQWRSPPGSFDISGSNHWEYQLNWDPKPLTIGNDPTAGDPPGGKQKFDMGEISPGVWTDFIVQAKWSYENDGILNIWRDGVQVVSHLGPNTYNDQAAHFFKLGIYKPDWHWAPHKSVVDHRVVYFDELNLETEVASLGSMTLPEACMPEQIVRTISAVADTRVVGVGDNRETYNLGGELSLPVRGHDWAGGVYTSYLAFDLTDLSANEVISGAVLQLTNDSAVDQNLKIYGLSDSYTGGADGYNEAELGENWLEGTGLWGSPAGPGEINGDRAPAFDEQTGTLNPAQTTLLGEIDFTGSEATDTLIEFASTELIDWLQTDTDGRITLIIQAASNTTLINTFDSKETSNAPKLEIASQIIMPGDYDYDNDIDGNDFLKWQRGLSPNPLSNDDFEQWEQQFPSSNLPSASVVVPEPRSIYMVLLAFLLLTKHRKW